MIKYILLRLFMTLPMLLGVSLITFSVMHITPGDPALAIIMEEMGGEIPPPEIVEEVREELGLNDPFVVQYGKWLGKVLHGNLGISFLTNYPVLDEITSRIPATLELALASMLTAVCLGIPLGVIAAMKPYSLLDYMCMTCSMLGVSIPNFWLSLLLMLLFSLSLGLLPVAGYGGIKYLVLPAFTMGSGMAAILARLTRASILDVVSQDHVLTARVKGLKEKTVLTKHVLKNAMIPVITYAGLQLGGILGGAVIVETIFARPGIGQFFRDAVYGRDFPAIQGCVLFFSFVYIMINLLVDISYALLDPRIRYGIEKT